MPSKLKLLFLIIISILFNCGCSGQNKKQKILTGAEQPELYLSLIKHKNIALMVNQSSLVDSVHLIDFLLSKNYTVSKIFAVEHGLRGNAANGEEFNNSVDEQTGLPIVSLYGKKKKPDQQDLAGIDLVIFDMQDVGCRFFTYISSMHYLMESCAENNVQLLILDRPNPNGDYIDGPVLNPELKSFVGMHPIPIVHGCTIGELALMINNEEWLTNGIKCKLKIIPVKNYTHNTSYSLPVKPSPNLPNDISIRLYPSLCLFEATNVSIGRGTHFPFQVIGFPDNRNGKFSFTPISIKGMSNNPPFENYECKGIDLRIPPSPPGFTLNYFIQFFNQFSNKDDFWKSKRWIDLLTGDKNFYQEINDGWNEKQIKATWENDINNYKTIRKKYLLYPDFE